MSAGLDGYQESIGKREGLAAHTRMLSLIRLFLYPFSSVVRRCVSFLFEVSVASIQVWSKVASGSFGPARRRHSTASRYLCKSRPLLASATAAFRASTHSGTELRPIKYKRSKRVRPGDKVSVQEQTTEGEFGAAPTFIVLYVKIKVKLGVFYKKSIC